MEEPSKALWTATHSLHGLVLHGFPGSGIGVGDDFASWGVGLLCFLGFEPGSLGKFVEDLAKILIHLGFPPVLLFANLKKDLVHILPTHL